MKLAGDIWPELKVPDLKDNVGEALCGLNKSRLCLNPGTTCGLLFECISESVETINRSEHKNIKLEKYI